MGLFFLLFYYYLIQIRGRETKGVGHRIEEYLGDTGIFAEDKEKTNYIASKPRKALISYLIPILLTLGGQVIVFLFLPWYLSVAWAAVIGFLIVFSIVRLISFRRYLRRKELNEWFDLKPILPLTEPDQGLTEKKFSP